MLPSNRVREGHTAGSRAPSDRRAAAAMFHVCGVTRAPLILNVKHRIHLARVYVIGGGVPEGHVSLVTASVSLTDRESHQSEYQLAVPIQGRAHPPSRLVDTYLVLGGKDGVRGARGGGTPPLINTDAELG